MDMARQSTPSSSAASSSKKLPFTSSERELIVALVRERPIIEDKRTNAKNIELKKQAWEDLTVAFNTQPYVSKRNSQQLKIYWENIKTLRKKELSQESYNMTRTGGGPPQGASTSSDNVVDVICPFINLTVPGVIESNSIGISADLKKPGEEKIYLVKDDELDELVLGEPEKKKLKTKLAEVAVNGNGHINDDEISSIKSIMKAELNIGVFSSAFIIAGKKKFFNEVDARIKRCSFNIQQDQELHELRLQRERSRVIKS